MRPVYFQVGSCPRVQSELEGYITIDDRQYQDDDDDDDDEYEDTPWLDFSEINSMGSCGCYPKSFKAKKQLGLLHDYKLTGKTWRIEACFHLSQPWWVIQIVRTSKQSSLFRPKDFFSLSYRIRKDIAVKEHKLLVLWIKACQKDKKNFKPGNKEKDAKVQNEDGNDVHVDTTSKGEFMYFDDTVMDNFFRAVGKEVDKLTFTQLDELDKLVEKFCDSDETGIGLKIGLKISEAARYVRKAVKYPILFHYLPQLFPLQFSELILQDDIILDKVVKVLNESPWILGFRSMLYNKLRIMGCEAPLKALDLCGLLSKMPVVQRDALVMYEFVKCDTKANGHTCSRYEFMLKLLNQSRELLGNPMDALIFLQDNNIVKLDNEENSIQVYLYSLWKCEWNIASGLNDLIKENGLEPRKLKIDIESEVFDKLKSDKYQMEAVRILTNKPVAVISGKGGCGKTEVVTCVMRNARLEPKLKDSKRSPIPKSKNDMMGELSRNGSRLDGSIEHDSDLNIDPNESRSKDDGVKDEVDKSGVMPLYTAPTGKAANLLGRRAKMEAFTLHQVIYSYRAYKLQTSQDPNSDKKWKHHNINILVVDECSLVSVQTFSTLLNMLMEKTKLCRVVLLGDWRQLPSVEPGNFLGDVFRALTPVKMAVELKINHRAESELIIQNAKRISERTMPIFNKEANFVFCGSETEEMDSVEITKELKEMLKHDNFSSDKKSHLIAFQRHSCEKINEICCMKYNNHSLKTDKNKMDFRKDDKICLTRNGNVVTYTSQKFCEDMPVLQNASDAETTTGGQAEEAENMNADNELTGRAESQCDHIEPKPSKEERLCNGEIYFIVGDIEFCNKFGKSNRYITLSDFDEVRPRRFTAIYRELRRNCKMKHAWARTIHTFQGSEIDTIGYVLYPCWLQNWQHVYTAVTRGRKAVHITGSKLELQKTVSRKHESRKTSLNKHLNAGLSMLSMTGHEFGTQISPGFSSQLGTQVPRVEKWPGQTVSSQQSGQTEVRNVNLPTHYTGSQPPTSTQPTGRSSFGRIPEGEGQQKKNNTSPPKRNISDLPSKFVSRESPRSWYKFMASQNQQNRESQTGSALSSQTGPSETPINAPVRNLFSGDLMDGSESPLPHKTKPTHTSTPFLVSNSTNHNLLDFPEEPIPSSEDLSLLNVLKDLQESDTDSECENPESGSMLMNVYSSENKGYSQIVTSSEGFDIWSQQNSSKAESQSSQWSEMDDDAYGDLDLGRPSSFGYTSFRPNKSPSLLSDSSKGTPALSDTSSNISNSFLSPQKRLSAVDDIGETPPKLLRTDSETPENHPSPVRRRLDKLNI